MYWGHAVSRDLVHWTHMPYVLEPQPDLWRDKEHKGGAFSGSAQVMGEQMHLYLTRHHGPQEDGEKTREWQTEAVCSDGIHVEKERPCITERPEGASFDFRDPKVQQVEGKDYMVLGSSLDGVPSILLYVREDGGWSFKGPLLQEHERALQRKEMMGGGLLKPRRGRRHQAVLPGQHRGASGGGFCGRESESFGGMDHGVHLEP